jgi:hypothetical protein
MSDKSDNPAEEEPSIEEILASIRQIISDDDEDEVLETKEEEKPLENPVHDSADDVLELTEDDLVEDEPKEEDDEDEEEQKDLQIEMRDRLEEIRRQSEEKPEEPAMDQKKPMPSDILSSGTQAAALDSLTKLTKRMPIERSRSYDGVTLEDIVRELLHPMLREWMDDNLPGMVERTVQKELEKLARRAMDD